MAIAAGADTGVHFASVLTARRRSGAGSRYTQPSSEYEERRTKQKAVHRGANPWGGEFGSF
jgi:hypothetical protein